jgi:PleD family two-component response regulator
MAERIKLLTASLEKGRHLRTPAHYKKAINPGAYVPEQLPTGTERILFVDDEAPIAKMGSQILEGLGYSVTTIQAASKLWSCFRPNP